MASLQVASQNTVAGPDDLFAHYRTFRQRFHLGCPSVGNVKFAPLSGPWMDRLAMHAGQERLESGQVLFDIMASLDDRLLAMDFDEDDKAPTARHHADLCRVTPDPPRAGNVFIHSVPDGHRSPNSDPQVPTGISLLRKEFARAVEYMPDSKRHVIDRMNEIFRRHRDGGFEDEKHMQGVHSALLYELVAGLAPEPGPPGR